MKNIDDNDFKVNGDNFKKFLEHFEKKASSSNNIGDYLKAKIGNFNTTTKKFRNNTIDKKLPPSIFISK